MDNTHQKLGQKPGKKPGRARTREYTPTQEAKANRRAQRIRDEKELKATYVNNLVSAERSMSDEDFSQHIKDNEHLMPRDMIVRVDPATGLYDVERIIHGAPLRDYLYMQSERGKRFKGYVTQPAPVGRADEEILPCMRPSPFGGEAFPDALASLRFCARKYAPYVYKGEHAGGNGSRGNNQLTDQIMLLERPKHAGLPPIDVTKNYVSFMRRTCNVQMLARMLLEGRILLGQVSQFMPGAYQHLGHSGLDSFGSQGGERYQIMRPGPGTPKRWQQPRDMRPVPTYPRMYFWVVEAILLRANNIPVWARSEQQQSDDQILEQMKSYERLRAMLGACVRQPVMQYDGTMDYAFTDEEKQQLDQHTTNAVHYKSGLSGRSLHAGVYLWPQKVFEFFQQVSEVIDDLILELPAHAHARHVRPRSVADMTPQVMDALARIMGISRYGGAPRFNASYVIEDARLTRTPVPYRAEVAVPGVQYTTGVRDK